MTTLTLDHPHHVTAGTVGEPGNRTFLVQVEDERHRVTMVAEKGQVAGMGDLVARLLVRLDMAPATDWDHAAMALRPPVEPSWRIGEVELELDVPTRLVAVRIAGLEVEPDAPFDEVAFTMDVDQARRLAGHVDDLVDQGRPRCTLCGRPMAAGGDHVCPSTNGHGRLTV